MVGSPAFLLEYSTFNSHPRHTYWLLLIDTLAIEVSTYTHMLAKTRAMTQDWHRASWIVFSWLNSRNDVLYRLVTIEPDKTLSFARSTGPLVQIKRYWSVFLLLLLLLKSCIPVPRQQGQLEGLCRNTNNTMCQGCSPLPSAGKGLDNRYNSQKRTWLSLQWETFVLSLHRSCIRRGW